MSRIRLNAGRQVVESTDKPTLQGFVVEHTAPGTTVYSDEASAYEGLPFEHESVKHSVAEYVRGMARTNGMESFWSMLKRAHMGTSTSSLRSISTGTCGNSPATTTSAMQTRWRRW